MRSLTVLLLAAVLVCLAPLAGLALAGHALAPYLQFPPRAAYLAHAPFSWVAFALFSLPLLAALFVIAWAAQRVMSSSSLMEGGKLPRWFWLGAAGIALGWFLAWTRDVAPPAWQRQGFTLLWCGYIVVMNALAYRRSARALLTHHTAWFALLFPASAVFWWVFEYLNQFSANWHYPGAESVSAREFFLQATLPFSTVLPAVASTWAWLRTDRRFRALLLPPLHVAHTAAWLSAIAGVGTLAELPLFPDWLFPTLWLAPLLVLAGLQRLISGESFDWRYLLQPALAALVCGFLWELWNYGAVARWEYSVPLVQRFHVFEMPLLGYAGYLPFGIECALVMDLMARAAARRSVTEFV